MKKFNTILALVWLAAIQLSAQAQVTVTTPEMIVDQGHSFHYPIEISSDESIVGMQFTVKWDSTILRYDSVYQMELPTTMSKTSHFGDLGHGILTFVWTEETLQGMVLGNNTTIYTIAFTAIGPHCSKSSIEIIEDPTLIEFATSDVVLSYDLIIGDVNIGKEVSTTETYTTDFTLFQNSPNPVTSFTNISFELNKRTDADLSIYDTSGRKIYKHKSTYSNGLHTINIQRDVFPAAGAYFYELKTDNAIARRKLLVL